MKYHEPSLLTLIHYVAYPYVPIMKHRHKRLWSIGAACYSSRKHAKSIDQDFNIITPVFADIMYACIYHLLLHQENQETDAPITNIFEYINKIQNSIKTPHDHRSEPTIIPPAHARRSATLRRWVSTWGSGWGKAMKIAMWTWPGNIDEDQVGTIATEYGNSNGNNLAQCVNLKLRPPLWVYLHVDKLSRLWLMAQGEPKLLCYAILCVGNAPVTCGQLHVGRYSLFQAMGAQMIRVHSQDHPSVIRGTSMYGYIHIQMYVLICVYKIWSTKSE